MTKSLSPVNIERLLDGHTVEGHRIEFKEGWNPNPIYRTICAFANDIANEGGGYIIVGVEEENGLPIRPVKGLPLNLIEHIGKEMVAFDNLINPVYHPKTSLEEVDDKIVFVIWCPAGQDRPYEVPDDVTAKDKRFNYRVRYNSSSIIPKGQVLRELLDLANNIPFDDRPNTSASITDVSQTLVRDFLVKTGSKLAQQIEAEPFRNILEAMELLAGPREAVYPRNVALMMFNDHPEKFFPYLQVDITIFPSGKLKDPDNFIEVPSIRGPIDSIYRKTMAYLETNVIKENVQKRNYKPEADRSFNYPIHALEEIVGNCLYHCDYRKREPITIEIEPDAMYISNPGGPDRSLKVEDFAKNIVRPRQYRNRRIGDFFKELNITEGKSTGVPTIAAAMKSNGSPSVKYEFDDTYSWFMVTVPVHPVFLNDSENVTVNVIVNDTVNLSKLSERQRTILLLIQKNERITIDEIQRHFSVTRRTIARDIVSLKEQGILLRVGSDKTGSWMIVKKVKGV
ncbi:MAG: putative DNA binding domain-containing protein [Bacteroidales bacterium]|nr:putative DNA binding domain-containing protein [Bacteroidales bacterium]